MHRVSANHNLVGHALVQLELVRVQYDAHQHGVGFIEINNLHTILRKCDGGVGQNILERCGQVSNRLDLDRLDC